MTVSSVTSAQSNPITAPIVSSKKTLGSDDFMKLLAVQFQQQDPMKPMDDTAFIAQMAQFTSLSQSQSMATEMTKLSTSQGLATANSYLGHLVTVDNGDGTVSANIVTGVQVSSAGPKIIVGGNAYAISSVLYVQPAPVSIPATPTAA